MSKAKSSKSRKKATLASKADRHQLYEMSVQCAESEVDFVDSTFKKLRGRRAQLLREDFCGTANVCCEWVKRRKSNLAIGVDIDPEVLDWGRDHNLKHLSDEKASRITLHRASVMDPLPERPEIVLAMNFSYWLFKERENLKRYFEHVHSILADDGILFMDAYGGYESFRELDEDREIDDGGKGFTYIWQQKRYNPIDGNLLCHIHFEFPDGSKLKKAFSYDWRLWTLPEVQDLLREAGFGKVTVYWQGWDKHGEADGNFKPATKADADAGWICYIAAEK